MTTLYLMRHGQTLFNMKRRIQGSCDSPLTAKGIEQAKRGADIIDTLNIDVAYCSTAERASDTLELVTRGKMPYQRLKGLKERDFAIFEGESEDLHPQWENGMDDIYPLFGGENFDQVSKRVSQTCTEIMLENEGKNVLAVSHAGAIASFLRTVVGEEALQVLRGKHGIENCTIVKFEFNHEDKSFTFIELIKPDFTGIE